MHIVRVYRWLIISLTVVATLASLIFTYRTPAYYDSSISFSINRVNQQETSQYQYDGYYAIQAADLFSQTVISWFMTPSVLLEMYDKAKIDPQISSLTEISSRFRVKKYSPQNIVVTYKERDRQTAEKIAEAIISVTQEKAVAANQTADKKALFEVIGTQPVIVVKKPPVVMNTIVGFIGGLFLSILAAYIIEYWKKSEPSTNLPK